MGSKCGLPSVAALRQLREQTAAIGGLLEPLARQVPEAVHETRVASRRIRILLKEFSDTWEGASRKRFGQRVREVTQALGAPRELDVCMRLARGMDQSPGDDEGTIGYLLDTWGAERRRHDQAVRDVAATLGSREFADAYEALLSGLRRSGSCYRKLACSRLERRSEAVRKAYRKWRKEPSDELLHAFRIALKKLRYACEALREVFEPQDMDRVLQELRDAQKRLGEWHDWHVTGRRIRDTVEAAPEGLGERLKAFAKVADRTAKQALEAFGEQARRLFEGKRSEFPALQQHDCKRIHRQKPARAATGVDA